MKNISIVASFVFFASSVSCASRNFGEKSDSRAMQASEMSIASITPSFGEKLLSEFNVSEGNKWQDFILKDDESNSTKSAFGIRVYIISPQSGSTMLRTKGTLHIIWQTPTGEKKTQSTFSNSISMSDTGSKGYTVYPYANDIPLAAPTNDAKIKKITFEGGAENGKIKIIYGIYLPTQPVALKDGINFELKCVRAKGSHENGWKFGNILRGLSTEKVERFTLPQMESPLTAQQKSGNGIDIDVLLSVPKQPSNGGFVPARVLSISSPSTHCASPTTEFSEGTVNPGP